MHNPHRIEAIHNNDDSRHEHRSMETFGCLHRELREALVTWLVARNDTTRPAVSVTVKWADGTTEFRIATDPQEA